MIRVLNLGAGVQSTTIYLMACANKEIANACFGQPAPKLPYPDIGLIDYAVFADTQDEPEEVYRHVAWLQTLNGPTLLVRTKGRLSEHLKVGTNSTGGRFASIPAFTHSGTQEWTPGSEGRLRRQCTREYKLEVIDRAIRREILLRAPRQRVPKGVKVEQLIGISLDEKGRATRLQERIFEEHIHWLEIGFPLLDMYMTREHCKEWLREFGNVPHEVPRSACVYCPFHDDEEWLRIKQNPRDWALAVEVDEALRVPGNVVNRNVDQKMYLHRSCKPLVQIEFNPTPNPRKQQGSLNFSRECLGMCGV